jgi:hypothetical protein
LHAFVHNFKSLFVPRHYFTPLRSNTSRSFGLVSMLLERIIHFVWAVLNIQYSLLYFMRNELYDLSGMLAERHSSWYLVYSCCKVVSDVLNCSCRCATIASSSLLNDSDLLCICFINGIYVSLPSTFPIYSTCFQTLSANLTTCIEGTAPPIHSAP